jgi:CTP:molybdopterin cytidylyltransferase MocA
VKSFNESRCFCFIERRFQHKAPQITKLRIDGETFLARCSRLLLRPDVERLVLVLGHEAERVCAFGGLPKDAAEAIGAEAVLMHPVDHPLLAEATVERVIAALAGGGGRRARGTR